MTNLKIGLCGTGNVGSAFIESIVSSESLINQNYGLNISISLIGARKGKVAGVSDISVITDIQEVSKSDDVALLGLASQAAYILLLMQPNLLLNLDV